MHAVLLLRAVLLPPAVMAYILHLYWFADCACALLAGPSMGVAAPTTAPSAESAPSM